jgi:hypothetical protein
MSDYYRYVQQLGKEQDFTALKIIYTSNTQFSGDDGRLAAAVAVRNSEPELAVVLCSTFEVGSSNWTAAFSALQYHPREVVVGYIRHIIHSPDPYVRYRCYTLCRRAGWDDLVDYAMQDVSNDTVIVSVNGSMVGGPEALGRSAREYITTFRPASPPPTE